MLTFGKISELCEIVGSDLVDLDLQYAPSVAIS